MAADTDTKSPRNCSQNNLEDDLALQVFILNNQSLIDNLNYFDESTWTQLVANKRKDCKHVQFWGWLLNYHIEQYVPLLQKMANALVSMDEDKAETEISDFESREYTRYSIITMTQTHLSRCHRLVYHKVAKLRELVLLERLQALHNEFKLRFDTRSTLGDQKPKLYYVHVSASPSFHLLGKVMITQANSLIDAQYQFLSEIEPYETPSHHDLKYLVVYTDQILNNTCLLETCGKDVCSIEYQGTE